MGRTTVLAGITGRNGLSGMAGRHRGWRQAGAGAGGKQAPELAASRRRSWRQARIGLAGRVTLHPGVTPGHTGFMPEGDVVWYTARRLHEALAGRTLTRSDFRVPRLATSDLTGDVVTEAVSRGKHLIIRTRQQRTVHTHLRMDGSWRIAPAAEPMRDSHRIRLILANAEWRAIGYQLGVVELIRTSEEWRVTGHLGPDLLGPDWDRAEAVRRLSAKPDRPVGEALLDQRNLAGIGTWFLAEMLFLQGIDPSRPVGSVENLDALVSLGHRLLETNKTRLGHTSTGDTAPGRESWVYGRAGRPCRRCGTLIKRGEQGPPGQERLRFWCPNCQR